MSSKTTRRVSMLGLAWAMAAFGQLSALSTATSSKISPDLTAMATMADLQQIATESSRMGVGSGASGNNATVRLVFHYDATSRKAIDQWVNTSKATVIRDLVRVNSLVVNTPTSSLSSLAAISGVRFVTPDRVIKRTLENAVPGVLGNIAHQNNWSGSNIGIAIIDSGVNPHGDLAGRIAYSENFVPNETTTADLYGHGTHVAVIAAGNAAQSSGSASFTKTFKGLAPGGRIINLRVLDANGAGSDSSVIAAIDRAIQLKNTHNIRIMNLSLGRRVMESFQLDPLCQAVRRAWEAGIVVVVAAGNRGRDNTAGTRGYATIGSPGNSPYVITVGAMRDMGTTTRADDRMASYSSKGPTMLDGIVKPDLVAPGNRVVSGLSAPTGTLATKYPQYIVNRSFYQAGGTGQGPYLRLSGTSMATPVVSGAVAMMLQRDPTLSPDTVKARLMKTATKTGFPANHTQVEAGVTYNVQYDIFAMGAGYLDVWAALNSNEVAAPGKRALSRQVIKDPATNKFKLSSSNIMWGENILWGDAIWTNSTVFGSNVLWGDNILWGDNVVWGDATTGGFNVIWGSNVLWGESLTFPEGLSAVGDGDQ